MEEKFNQLKILMNSDVNYSSLNNVLKNLSILMRSSQNRDSLNSVHWEEISKLCNVGMQILSKTNYTTEELEVVAEIFRFLRNSCGGSGKNHLFLLNSSNTVDFAKKPLKDFILKETAEEITILKICIQLFGNILVLSDSAKPLVWELFFKEFRFKYLFESKDQALIEYSMMVLYNSMSEENTKDVLFTKEGHEVVIAVTNVLMENFIDWGMLFMEHLLKRTDFFKDCFNSLPLENRLFILDIIIDHLKSAENESVFFPVSSIEFIKNRFINLVKEIACFCDVNSSNVEPSEFVKMLSILCTASVCNAFIPFMLSCQDLLQKCIETLKCVHLLGKKGSNMFSTISNAKILTAQYNEQIVNHPLYGFKKDLVKLIGNLCYGCKENQDLVRELDGIPLVLDCCNLDAKNPYIMQWCILAIRNIVDHNPENQAVLAGITTTGEIADSSFLKEIGINVHFIDGKLSLS